MNSLPKLIEKLEKAEEGSRELDFDMNAVTCTTKTQKAPLTN